MENIIDIFQDHGSLGRVPIITPMTWIDDWPIMGIEGKAPVTIELEGKFTGNSMAKNDDFDYEENIYFNININLIYKIIGLKFKNNYKFQS